MTNFSHIVTGNNAFIGRLERDQLHHIRQSALHAFRAGDFQYAAQFAEPNSALAALSFIMIGNPWRGLAILDQQSIHDDETQLYRAFAYWYMAQKDQAIDILQPLASDELSAFQRQAQRFLDLLSMPRIAITASCYRKEMGQAFQACTEFDVRLVGVPGQMQDMPLCADHFLQNPQDVAFLEKSAFYLHYDLGTPAPLNLNHIPKLRRVGFVLDPDMHLFNDAAFLAGFHQVITTSSQCSIELEALYQCPTWTLPLFGGLSASHRPIQQDYTMKRQPELLFTGSVATPIYPDKIRRFFALSQADSRFRLRLLDQTFQHADYERLLSSVSISPVSMRILDGSGTRTIQALQSGQAVVHFGTNILALYLDDARLLCPITEDMIDADLGTAFTRLESMSAHEKQAMQNQLQNMFPASPMAETRLLKAICFLNIMHDHKSELSLSAVNRAINWFTHRPYQNLKQTTQDLLPSPMTKDYAVKRLFSEACRLRVEQQSLTQQGFLHLLDQSRAAYGPQKILAIDMLDAFVDWFSDDQSAFIAKIQQIWNCRADYQATEYDGLIFFDLKVCLFMRSEMISESHVADIHIENHLSVKTEKQQTEQSDTGRALLSGIAAFLAKQAVQAGQIQSALDLSQHALALCPRNGNAHFVRSLALMDHWLSHPDTDMLPAIDQHWTTGVIDYPWRMVEAFPRLMVSDALDAAVYGGNTAAIYLKFMQRIRTNRPTVSAFHLPAASLAYLKQSLGLPHTACTAEQVRGALTGRNLIVCEEAYLMPNIIEPLMQPTA